MYQFIGIYSKSVQETLYYMAISALKKESQIDKIVIQMPNIHNIPFPLENYGLSNKGQFVYFNLYCSYIVMYKISYT